MRRTAATLAAAMAAFAAMPQPAMAAVRYNVTCPNDRLPALLGGAGTNAMRLHVTSMATRRTVLRLAVAWRARDLIAGLACVDKLQPRTGMLFVFPLEKNWTFWMRETRFPIDIAWIGRDGIVNKVASDVQESSENAADNEIEKRDGVGMYVVEVPAGEAAQDGLREGAIVVVPRILHS